MFLVAWVNRDGGPVKECGKLIGVAFVGRM